MESFLIKLKNKVLEKINSLVKPFLNIHNFITNLFKISSILLILVLKIKILTKILIEQKYLNNSILLCQFRTSFLLVYQSEYKYFLQKLNIVLYSGSSFASNYVLHNPFILH